MGCCPWAMDTYSTGKPVVIRWASRPSFCTAGRVLVVLRGCAASSIQQATTSSCSINATADAASHTPATHPLTCPRILPIIWSRTSKPCAATWALTAGWLGIDRWLVYGQSWGSTLALAYAQSHPDQVTEIILAGVTTTRRSEIDWLYRGMSPLFPEQWSRFRAGVPESECDNDLVEAYYRLLNNPDLEVRAQAAQNWHDWEAASISIDPAAKPSARWLQPDYRMARARIITHYFHHNAWLVDQQLLRNAGVLREIPGILIQGRLDLSAPLVTAWELAQVWPGSELIIVPGQ